jgi:glycosyltransferase involved in cell wall biosynthesis
MQIQLRGYVTAAELRDLYQRAAIFAFPSLDEGFGIPVLEAMAHATPVLTSNRSALPEVAGDAAFLADPYEADEMSAALRRLIEDMQLRTRLGNAGMERAKLFPWKRAVSETWETYQSL